ncbi:MAG: hypothetical protein KFF50_01335, partial [Desulfatitalea sp.]|nr:hypothetical protein [Desulfatitalea sp.]
MKPKALLALLMVLATAAVGLPVCDAAEDMRDRHVQAEQARRVLLEKAAAEKRSAEQEAAASRSRIVGDRDTLAQTIAALKKRNQQLTTAVDDLTALSGALTETEQALSRQLAETDSMVREMVGVVRVNAKDLEGLILQSPQTALNDPDLALLRDIADQAHFPGMADIRRMT